MVGEANAALGLMGILLLVVALLAILALLARRYQKVGPNEVMIISGWKWNYRDPRTGKIETRGFRIKKGGGTIVVPIVEKAEILSLELFTLDVKTPEVYTSTGVPVIVDGVAQVKVKGDDVSIATAAEQFLSKNQREVMNVCQMTVEGHLRAILGTMTVEDIYKNREEFSRKVQEMAATDMQNMGLHIVSFTLKDIKDTHGYLDALGVPRIAAVKRDAQIAQAEADRDATIRSAMAKQAGEQAKYLAETKIAEANRDYQTNLAQYTAAVNQKKAEADLAYDLQKNIVNQSVMEEEGKVRQVQKNQDILVAEKEIARRQKELEASVQKPADAHRYQIQIEADAERYRLETVAKGQSEGNKMQGFAQADIVKAQGIAQAEANRAKGFAEADVVKAQGLSTAEAMEKKASAWRNYNQAAIAQMMIEAFPAIARAVAEPLGKIDRMVVIGGGGDSAGASKITQEVANVIAQLPPVIEALSGLDLQKLLSELPKLGEKLKQTPPETK